MLNTGLQTMIGSIVRALSPPMEKPLEGFTACCYWDVGWAVEGEPRWGYVTGDMPWEDTSHSNHFSVCLPVSQLPRGNCFLLPFVMFLYRHRPNGASQPQTSVSKAVSQRHPSAFPQSLSQNMFPLIKHSVSPSSSPKA